MPDTTPSHPLANRAGLTRISLVLYRATGLLMLAFPLAVVLLFALADDSTLMEQSHLHAHDLRSTLAAWQRVAAALVTLLALSMLLRAFHHARSCFLSLSQGRHFDLDVVRRLRAVAIWGCLSSAASFVARPILSVLLTFGNPRGTRMLTLGIDGTQVTTLFFAGLIWAMASVLAEACVLARENSEFV